MDSLTESLLPLRFRPDPDNDETVFLIDPPTVKQALLLYGLAPFGDDKSYEARIRQVMDEWLDGSGLLQFLEENEIAFETQLIILQTLLNSCEPQRKKKADEDESLTWKRDVSMSLLVAEYRYWFRCDVFAESWPVFLNQLHCMDKLRAEVGFANLAWYAAGRSKDSLDNLMKRAGYERVKYDMPEIPEQEIAMQLENAKLIGRMGMA